MFEQNWPVLLFKDGGMKDWIQEYNSNTIPRIPLVDWLKVIGFR